MASGLLPTRQCQTVYNQSVENLRERCGARGLPTSYQNGREMKKAALIAEEHMWDMGLSESLKNNIRPFLVKLEDCNLQTMGSVVQRLGLQPEGRTKDVHVAKIIETLENLFSQGKMPPDLDVLFSGTEKVILGTGSDQSMYDGSDPSGSPVSARDAFAASHQSFLGHQTPGPVGSGSGLAALRGSSSEAVLGISPGQPQREDGKRLQHQLALEAIEFYQKIGRMIPEEHRNADVESRVESRVREEEKTKYQTSLIEIENEFRNGIRQMNKLQENLVKERGELEGKMQEMGSAVHRCTAAIDICTAAHDDLITKFQQLGLRLDADT